ncbi:phosphatase PAP2 family protein [Bradyrhizobium sp.]|uniref:phosphatase PAP2 family protein n=1 Tax=Bradyrhizobium sp. TaxID=376 RepID=UPI0039E313C2
MLKRILLLAVSITLVSPEVGAQTVTNIAVLKGLAPLTILKKSYAGEAALASNFTVTGGIQTGSVRQSTLLPFADQQQQALRDAFITSGNLAQLVDGLGTSLGSAYLARAHYADRQYFTSISSAVADLIAYTNATTRDDSNSAKFFFANGTTDGKQAVSEEAAQIFKVIGGSSDTFGRTYGRPAGNPGSDAYGNSRPFQTEPQIVPIVGPDYFNAPADNIVYNRGPIMNLIDSPSFPSGHTTYGYMGSILLAVLVPERYQQMIARGAEYGNDRILMGAHYAMDVLGGRTLATYDLAHLLANDPAYVGRTLKGAPVIGDYQASLKTARAELTAILQSACGDSVATCAKHDVSRLNDPATNEASYLATQTYGLPVVYPQNAGKVEDVGKIAPEAGYLLTAAFPSLTLEEADKILTETQGPGGGFLDDGSAFGVYSRLNLYAAGARAAQLVKEKIDRP